MSKTHTYQTFMRTASYIFAVGISIFFLFAVITYSWMGFEVKSNCQMAKRAYGGDCVGALSKLLADENRSYRERNSATWALGQIADKRALPTLERLYTGKIPDREPLDKTLSQYELRKAVKWCKEGNGTSWIYKNY